MNLEMYPDINDMLDGVAVGDVVKVTACFQVKELSDKKLTGAFEDKEGIKIKVKDAESEDYTDEEKSEKSDSEETSG